MGRVALAVAVAAAFFVSASAADADVVARPLKGHVVLRAAPDGAVVARLNRTEFGSPLVYSVGARRGHWLGVIAPQRPNGVLSWIDARTVRTWRTTVRIDVSLSRRTLELIRGGKVVRRVPLGIGAAASPTPTGEYAVTDRMAGADISSAYGCCILALSAHQEHPTSTWNGGTRIAIHGGALGAISNGCLHTPEGALRFLMTHVPLGTRVTIRA
jgi:L,D-transpeptidase catalytic domain